MTTTSMYSGIENVPKLSSRVLNPPGGKTNIFLGGAGEESAPEEVKTSPEVTDAAKQEQQQEQEDATTQPPAEAIKQADDSFGNLFGPTKSNNLPRGRRRFTHQLETGHNPVTGELNTRGSSDNAAEPSPTKGRAKPERVDPASLPAAGGRVEGRTPMKRQPPGGKDSGIFS